MAAAGSQQGQEELEEHRDQRKKMKQELKEELKKELREELKEELKKLKKELREELKEELREEQKKISDQMNLEEMLEEEEGEDKEDEEDEENEDDDDEEEEDEDDDSGEGRGAAAAAGEGRKEEHQEQLLELKKLRQDAVDLTLDPDTANPKLILSDDGKQVQHGGKKEDLPDNPLRFNHNVSVLSKESFTEGRFYFEVLVKGKTQWTLGVARESINRKGRITVCPDEGFWAIRKKKKKEYEVLEDSPVCQSRKRRPEKVGVFVDYEERRVSFYDADTEDLIYPFTDCVFTEELYPYFSPGPFKKRNSAPLVITPVRRQEPGGA